mgnify:CR=1 FL=1
MTRWLDNVTARRGFLDRHALAEQPTGPGKGDDLHALIERLGFVQLDSVRTLERAHHMILFARRQAYRPRHLPPLLAHRQIFEHWTHDAAVIPMDFYPHWHIRFARDRAGLHGKWERWQSHEFLSKCAEVMAHIRENGPCGSGDVGTEEGRSKGGWWDWHPSKTALEYLWRAGDLSVTRRDAFRKVYDLTERVIPAGLRVPPPVADSIDWLCHNALTRLGFATSGEIAAFWAHVSPAEAKQWCEAGLANGALEPLEIETADGAIRKCLTFAGATLAAPDPPGRMRVLSPFDPALRDRKRAERLFGFHYRIEIFVPAPKRVYGYYVFPLLEGARIVGRIDMARVDQSLHVTALWPERGVKWGDGRQARLEAELTRLARFAGLEHMTWASGWRRDPI